MNKAYSGYSYKRYKRPIRRRIFPLMMAVISIGVLFFVANLFFGFISFAAKPSKVLVNAVTFYTTESESFVSKSDAIEQATLIKASGGSGYLLSNDNQWTAVNKISNKPIDGGKKYATSKKKLKLVNKDHTRFVITLLDTFAGSFEMLCDYIEKFEMGTMQQTDIANSARIAYNNLVELAAEFETAPGANNDPTCAGVVVYVTRQLLGLNMVWVEGNSSNFSHVLKNAACWIIFAYFDLVNSL